jgi:hypothetical protein
MLMRIAVGLLWFLFVADAILKSNRAMELEVKVGLLQLCMVEIVKHGSPVSAACEMEHDFLWDEDR